MTGWDVDRLSALPAEKRLSLYRNARAREDAESRRVAQLIVDNDLLVEPRGGLPWDHPLMVEIAAICHDGAAVDEAVAASERSLPALAGMEHRLVAALGERYGTHNTTNYAGICVRDAMATRGWHTTVQRPMPRGSVAKSATVFTRKERAECPGIATAWPRARRRN